MYALLLIASMLGQEAPPSTASDSPKASRRIPVESNRLSMVTEVVNSLNVKECTYSIANSSDEGQKILVLSAKTEEDLDQIHDTLEKLHLAKRVTSVKTIELKHSSPAIVINSLQFKGTGNATVVPDAKGKRIIATGTKSELALVEALVTQLDKPNKAEPRGSGDEKRPPFGEPIEFHKGAWPEICGVIEELKLQGNDSGGVAYNYFERGDRQFLRLFGIDAAQYEKVKSALEKKQLTGTLRNMRVFRLQHADVQGIATTLNQLKMPNMTIVADAQSNSVIATGANGDINIIEALLANLDIKRAADQKAAMHPAGPDSDLRNYVYHLTTSSASEVANSINKMEIDGVRIIADERTNSVIVQAGIKELKLVIRIIQTFEQKEFKVDDSKLAAPNPVIGTLWSDFAKAEAKSIATAGELRAAAAKFGDSHPTMIELRTKLETDVKVAFEFRHKLQQAEAAALRQQLGEIEQRLAKREKNRASIIKARVESLLNLDELGWEAMTKPKTPKDEVVGGANPLVNESAAKNLVGQGSPSRQMRETWERLDREEYISVKASSQVAGMGGGGLGGMGGGFGGFSGPPGTPQPVSINYQYGALICGNAMIRDSYGGLQNEQVVWVGNKELPCRLAGLALGSIHAYRSTRFPSLGITDFTHKPMENELAWAFVPGKIETLVKAKVFRKSSAEFEIDEATSFGIEAEGKIETGYIVCTNDGDFLGFVSYHHGSLGACWSAPAIGEWLQRTNMEAPEPADPLSGRVIIALQGSHYLPIPLEGGGRSTPKPGSAFYGSIIKGVIVTHPEVSKSDLQNSGKVLYGAAGASLTIDKMKLSEDGRFTLIWCKELTSKSGFTSAHDVVRSKEFAIPLGTRANTTYQSPDDTSRVIAAPFKDEIDHFSTAQRSRSVVAQADDKGFNLEWFGSFNAIGAPVTSVGGHFLGVVDFDKDVVLKSSQEFQETNQNHTIHVTTADEMLRFVEAEIKKATASANTSTPAIASNDSQPAGKVDSSATTQGQKDAFWLSIKEPDAVIPVHAMAKDRGNQFSQQPGAIVKGFIFFSSPLKGGALAEVGEKSLPQRLVTITPGGLYGYHRDRLPEGYQNSTALPKEGYRVWTISDGDRKTTTSGRVFTSGDSDLEIQVNKESEFTFESDGRLEAGAVVFSAQGEFLGIVARNKGSIGVCETAQTIFSAVERTNPARPKVSSIYEQGRVHIGDPEGKKGWVGALVKGVVVAPADVLDTDRTKLILWEGNKKVPMELKAGVKIFSDQLALLWIKSPALRSEGFSEARQKFIAGDYCRTEALGMFSNDIEAGKVKEIPASNPVYNMYASRIAKVDEITFALDWYGHGPFVCDPIVDVGGHWAGINLTKDDRDPSKQSPSSSKRQVEIIKATEILRLIDEESKKLAAAKPSEAEKPKSETTATEAPKEGSAPPP